MLNFGDLLYTLSGDSGYFGSAVAADGDLVVVGAPSASVGGVYGAGRTYVYNSQTGAPVATLTSPTPASDRQFGESVAISGGTLVVGAPGNYSAGTLPGSAYVFDAATGSLLQTLSNPTPAAQDYFGGSLAISGSTVVVGAPYDDTGATNAGSAYVFDAATGSLLQTLNKPAGNHSGFGISAAVSGSTLLVGASGAVYVYNAATGNLLQTLTPPGDPSLYPGFGWCVALSGNTAVVGESIEWHVFIYDAAAGTLVRTIDGNTANFGVSVAVSGNTVAVGAAQEWSGWQGPGNAYLFDAPTGTLLQTLNNPNYPGYSYYGAAVAVSGSTAVVGAPMNYDLAYVFEAGPVGNAIVASAWNDLVGDGVASAGVARQAGWTIYLDTNGNGQPDPGEPTQVTTTAQPSVFRNLADGTYTVREVLQSGWTQTAPAAAAYTVVLAGGQVVAAPFGNHANPGRIEGDKWSDANGNGIRDPGEPTLPGWTIYLDTNNNGQWNAGEPSQVTDASGHYVFANLVTPGTYTEREVPQSGWTPTCPAAGKYTVVIAPGQVVTGQDFGNDSTPGRIEGDEWNDLNGNGVRDPGEPALPGWTIYLDTNGNGQYDAGEPIQVTDASGHYVFNLPPGAYTVGQVPQPGWTQSYPERSLDNFDDGNISEYLEYAGTTGSSVTTAAAHDGPFGLAQTFSGSGNDGFLVRDDWQAHVAQGQVLLTWVKPAADSADFAFGASSSRTYSVVLNVLNNTFAIAYKQYSPYYYTSYPGSAAQTYLTNHWYRVEVNWGIGGHVVAKLFDSDGTTLLNTVAGTNTTITSGGIGFHTGLHGTTSWDTAVRFPRGQVPVVLVAGQVVTGQDYGNYDSTRPVAPSVALTNDTGISPTDKITSDGRLTLTGVQTGATVQYSIDGGSTWTSTFAPVEGPNSVQVRQTDAARIVGTASPALAFTLDTHAPDVSVTPVSPDPRVLSLLSIDFAFSEAAYHVGLAGLALTRDGAANLLAASGQAVGNPTGDHIHYRLAGISPLTAPAGHYTLTLTASGSAVTDAAGNPLTGTTAVSWTMIAETFGGTPGSDFFAFSTDGTHHYVSVTLAGQPARDYTYDASVAVTFNFNGNGGSDKITIDGGPQDETVVTFPNSAFFGGPTGTYQVVASGISDIEVTAGPGVGQTADMYDAPGVTDTFRSHPAYSEMLPTVGTAYYNRVTGFGPVSAWSSGDSGDTAKFYDSPGADTFTARPAFPAQGMASLASMACPGYATNMAHGFANQYGYASFAYGQPGQGDRANLYDGPGNDTWIGYGSLNYSEITGSGGAYYVRAQGFDKQYGYVTGGGTDNVARFYDTPGDDIFNAKGDYSYLAGADTQTWWFASGFQRVYAQETAGGNDRAYFSHTTGNYKATFNVRSYQGYMADSAGTFFNIASDFNEYEGVSSIPGNIDEAYLRTTGGGDTLTFQPVPGTNFAIADLLGTTPPPASKPVHLYAYGFHSNTILRDVTDTAFNTASLTGTGGSDTFAGTPNDSTLTLSTGPSVRLTYWPQPTPRGFDKILVNAGGGDDTATLTGAATGTNSFWGSLADAVLSDGTLDLSTGDLTTPRSPFGYYFKLSGFDALADHASAIGPGGATNHKHVIEPIDYVLTFSGTWLDV